MNAKTKIVVAAVVFGLIAAALWRIFPRQRIESHVPIAVKPRAVAPADGAIVPEKPRPVAASSAAPSTAAMSPPVPTPVASTLIALPAPAVTPASSTSDATDQSQPLMSSASQPQPLSQSDSILATQRMYLAHASLRTPEVADPDSVGNRQILQTMLAKALARPEATRP